MKLTAEQQKARIDAVKNLAPSIIASGCAQMESVARPTCERCKRSEATLVIELHRIDYCWMPNAGLTPDGDDGLVRCTYCALSLNDLVAEFLTKRLQGHLRAARFACTSCGRPITAIHDVLEVETI